MQEHKARDEQEEDSNWGSLTKLSLLPRMAYHRDRGLTPISTQGM